MSRSAGLHRALGNTDIAERLEQSIEAIKSAPDDVNLDAIKLAIDNKVQQGGKNLFDVATVFMPAKAGQNIGKIGRAGKWVIVESQIKNIDPKLLISTNSKNEVSGSQIKKMAKDMKQNGFDMSEPIDVAVVNAKTIIIDGHHRTATAIKANIKEVPVRIKQITPVQGNELLIQAAEARVRSY